MKITKKQLKQLIESAVEKHLDEISEPSVLQPLGRMLRIAELSQEELQVVKNAFYDLGSMASADNIPFSKLETMVSSKIKNHEDKDYLIGLVKKGWLRHKSQQAFPVREGSEKHLNEAPPEGWHGTTRAMITKHPEKFQEPGEKKKPGEINPWALAHSMKKKGAEPHYKEQETSLKGKPEKKKKFKNEEAMKEFNIPFMKKKPKVSHYVKINLPDTTRADNIKDLFDTMYWNLAIKEKPMLVGNDAGTYEYVLDVSDEQRADEIIKKLNDKKYLFTRSAPFTLQKGTTNVNESVDKKSDSPSEARWCSHCEEKVDEKECPFCGRPTRGLSDLADQAESLKEDYAPGMYGSVDEIINKYFEKLSNDWFVGNETAEHIFPTLEEAVNDAYLLGKEDGVEEYTLENMNDYEGMEDDD